jgi:hypothetical protein
VGAVGQRIADPQQRRDDLAHGVVQDETVRAELHERKRAQRVPADFRSARSAGVRSRVARVRVAVRSPACGGFLSATRESR